MEELMEDNGPWSEKEAWCYSALQYKVQLSPAVDWLGLPTWWSRGEADCMDGLLRAGQDAVV